MKTTKLSLQEKLPLTCSRSGTCCHGKKVLLNPWELHRLAREKKMAVGEFRDLHTDFGGIQLKFNGKSEWKGQAACSLYVENFGCSVHLGRPLACRLYPLGRQIQSNEVNYIFEGKKFPCLTDCAEVLDLPQLTVGEYLQEQETEHFEKAQDNYLELMQNLADMAFEFFLDTGLAQSGDTKTLQLWLEMGNALPEVLTRRIGQEWIDCLMIPEISAECSDFSAFAQQHNQRLETKVQEQFGAINTNQEFHEASILLMAIALQLARGIGANPAILADHWCEEAKGFLRKLE